VRYILKNLSTILLALVLAFLVWVAAVREQDPPREEDFDQVISIEITPPAETLVNTIVPPKSVQLRLLAPESSWKDLSAAKFKASVDMSNLPAGLSDVPVEVNVSDNQVRVIDQTPSEVSVNLEPVKVGSLPVQIQVQDTPPLGYNVQPPQVNPPTVLVSGPGSLVEQAKTATGEAFIRNSKTTVQTTSDVQIRDQDGKLIRGLTVEPATVDVTIPVQQRFGYKDVSVRASVDGRVAPGYRISNIEVTPPTVTIVGNPAALNEIGGLIETVPINLDQATEDIVRTVPLNLPNGVTTVASEDEHNGGPEGVQVTVNVTSIEDAITLKRPVHQQGIEPDLWWKSSPDAVDVFLSGPLPQLQSLRASDVEVIVDLFGLEPGVHILQPTVFKPDSVSLDAILPDTVEVTIGKTVQRPVTQAGLDNIYTWKALPNLVDIHLAGPTVSNTRAADVKAVVDLFGLGPGLHRLAPTVTTPTGIVVNSVEPETVTVDITVRPGIKLTPTATVAATSTVTGTPDSITGTPSP